jgi:hypothetical protein
MPYKTLQDEVEALRVSLEGQADQIRRLIRHKYALLRVVGNFIEYEDCQCESLNINPPGNQQCLLCDAQGVVKMCEKKQ